MGFMETKVREIQIGDRVKVKDDYFEHSFRGQIGDVTLMRGHGEVGVDFGKVIGGETWDLNGTLRYKTGRFMKLTGLYLFLNEWDI
jgi:hypothetical protein